MLAGYGIDVQTRRLGSSGLSVSRVGLGTMLWGTSVSAEEARDHLELFVARGGTLVDTAHRYGEGVAEELLGAMIGAVVPRDDIVVCTKAGLSQRGEQRVVDASRGRLMSQLDLSLRRLGTDHVDLWLVHAYDDQTPMEETASALAWAYQSGRARYVGASNFTGWQVTRLYSLLERSGVPLICDEVEYSLVNRTAEHEVVPAAEALGFGVLAWSPLGRGVLSGKYRHGVPAGSRATSARFAGFVQRFLDEQSRTVAAGVVTAAEGLGLRPAEVALAWVRDRPGVTSALVGARTTAQLKEALEAEDVRLPTEIVTALEDVSSTRA